MYDDQSGRQEEKDLKADTKRANKQKKRAQNQAWEDTSGLSVSSTNPHMPLTPAPGDERDIFAKQQEERLACLHSSSGSHADIVKWKRYFVLGTWAVQAVCVLILLGLSVKGVVKGDVEEGKRCGVKKVEVVGCGESCFEEDRRKETETVRDTATQTVNLRDGTCAGSASVSVSGGGGGIGVVKTLVVLTSTTTTIR
ncbi:uncharacterized protein RAG0_09507 [Rhynchosporium agropyri]|uniref:Uncharacterized protein n=1 Tax=Rhynchosporium agropyri TaxID=914238 RepID=A0A1E1KVS5_9HELO|nr:uncharacterized protein RAG0_09507 [Rhynchosporium agropyri]